MIPETFNEKFRERTKSLSLEIILSLAPLKYSDALGIIRKQIIRASTSVAANFRAVCRARSEKERFAKLCIVVEEANETLFWLEMLADAKLIKPDSMKSIANEATEILKVMSSYKKRLVDKI